MKNTISNKLKMYQAISTVCDKHQSAWDQTPAFVEAYNAFSGKVSLLKEQTMIQMAAVTGVAAHKRQVLNDVVDKALVLTQALYALALKTGDIELMARSIIHRSEWFRGNSHLRVNRLNVLKQDFITYETALVDYSVDQAFFGEFDALLAEYTVIVYTPRGAILERKGATETMDELIVAIDGLLKQLSLSMGVFRVSNSSFFKDFFNARLVVDIKGKRRGSKDSPPPVEPESDDGDGLS